MPGSGRLGRMRWLCRRGMKELDVLLEAFLLRRHEEIASGHYPELEELLSAEDDALWDWLQGADADPPAKFESLIAELRRGS